MQNRTLGIVLTAVSAFICGCAGLFSCIWGGLIATGTPIDVTSNGITAPQTFSPTIGYALVCLSLLFLLVPVGVGFFTLRKRDTAM
ncbi:MAG TPA: hypothetical protein VHO49_07525 [Anaerolineales bacterium]|nr:hypothetical protein [Anaerolineales bacterium]